MVALIVIDETIWVLRLTLVRRPLCLYYLSSSNQQSKENLEREPFSTVHKKCTLFCAQCIIEHLYPQHIQTLNSFKKDPNPEQSVSVMSEKESLLFLGRSSSWIFKPWLSQFGLSPSHHQHHPPGRPHELNRLSITNMSWSSRPCHGLHMLVMMFKYMSWSWRTCHDLSQASTPPPLRAGDENVQWNDQQRCSLTSSVNVCMWCTDAICKCDYT